MNSKKKKTATVKSSALSSVTLTFSLVSFALMRCRGPLWPHTINPPTVCATSTSEVREANQDQPASSILISRVVEWCLICCVPMFTGRVNCFLREARSASDETAVPRCKNAVLHLSTGCRWSGSRLPLCRVVVMLVHEPHPPRPPLSTLSPFSPFTSLPPLLHFHRFNNLSQARSRRKFLEDSHVISNFHSRFASHVISHLTNDREKLVHTSTWAGSKSHRTLCGTQTTVPPRSAREVFKEGLPFCRKVDTRGTPWSSNRPEESSCGQDG